RAVVDKRDGRAAEWLLRVDLHHLTTQRLRGESWRRGNEQGEGAGESGACREGNAHDIGNVGRQESGRTRPRSRRTRLQILPHGPHDGHRGTVVRDTQLARGAASTSA